MVLRSAGARACRPLRERCGRSGGDSPSSHAALFLVTLESLLEKGPTLPGRGQIVTLSSGTHQLRVGSHKRPRPSRGSHALC